MWKVSKENDSTAPKENEVWVKNGNIIHPVKIDVGINDGITAEIKSGLKEGDEVVLSMSAASEQSNAKASVASSPFMPKRPSKK